METNAALLDPQPHHEVFDKIVRLEEVILTAHPSLPVLLRDIHKQLANDPAIVTLLRDDQIAVIVSGLKKQTKIELVSASLKKTPTKALKNVSLDDF